MNFNAFIILLFFLINLGSCACARAEANDSRISTSSLQWLAFGDIRGHLEPCGCDPRSDLGSVQRLDAYLRRERMSHPGIAIFHLGNDFSTESEGTAARKNMAIAKALTIISPTVSLLNRREISKKDIALPPLNYVISNLRGTLPKGAREFIDGTGFRAFGFVEPYSESTLLLPFSQSLEVHLRKMMDRTKKRESVLLYSGSRKTLQKIFESHLFDVVIASNYLGDGREFGDEERRNESTLIALKNSKQDVLMVPVGGQGVIRSPGLQRTPPAQTVSSLIEKQKNAGEELKFGPANISSPSSGTAAPLLLDGASKPVIVKWLDPPEESGVSPEILAIISEYRDASNSAMASLIKSRLADLASSPFIGAEACQTCHASSYKKWKDSKHAMALPTLVAQRRQTDPECVSCHVLGFNAKGGYVSEAASPKFANVQCESCHGPRRSHIENPSLKGQPNFDAKNACAECHTKPHSPAFNFPEYWKKIQHK